ncbi:MAG: PhnD/SsuA/transferrin family substrate-binding protein [Rhizobiaceae bacterium]
MRKRYILFSLFCALLLNYFAFDSASGQTRNSTTEGEKTAVIGVLAFRGTNTTVKNWQPLIDYLDDAVSGWKFRLLPVTLVSASNLIESKRIDFLITNPGHYVTLAEQYGLSALSTRERLSTHTGRSQLTFGSVVFVKKQSNIKALSELKGKTIAAVSPGAFGGFQIAWSEMKAQGIDAFRDIKSVRYMGFPQDAIISAVSKGEVDAGIVRSGLLEQVALEGRLELDTLRVLNANTQLDYPHLISSHLYPEWPFAALAGIDKTLREDVLRVLLNTQNRSTVDRYELLDIWSAPLSYEKVRLLVNSYRKRANGEGQIYRNVAFAVTAAIAFSGLIFGVGVLWRKKSSAGPDLGAETELNNPELLQIRQKFESLTPREREILVMVCNGSQNKKIAEELHISPKTVEFHRTNLLHKTEAGTTAHLVQLATRLGFDQGVSLG